MAQPDTSSKLDSDVKKSGSSHSSSSHAHSSSHEHSSSSHVHRSSHEHSSSHSHGSHSHSGSHEHSSSHSHGHHSHSSSHGGSSRSSSGSRSSSHSGSGSNKKEKKKVPKGLIIAGGIILLLAIVMILVFHALFGGLKRVKINKGNLGVVEINKDDMPKGKHDIVNFVVFGVDTRDLGVEFGDPGRSDTIIIVSVDKTENSINLISVLRDLKVPIEGYEPQKINAAYAYGLAPLAIKTLNQNFQLDIENYVTVNFATMADVIDMVGGVDITLRKEEAELVNQYAEDLMGYKGHDAVEGINTLNGAQALSYSRIRALDSDLERAGRQRLVLKALFAKVRKRSVTEYPSLIKTFLSCVETSFSYGDILSLALSLNITKTSIHSHSMPTGREQDLWSGIDENGAWVWEYDLNKATDRIHGIIYGDQE